MQSPIRVADETFVIPMPFEIPGFGILYINSMVIRGQEPILVETSAPIARDDYLQAAFSLVDPKDVRWIFFSHDDRDHSGKHHVGSRGVPECQARHELRRARQDDRGVR